MQGKAPARTAAAILAGGGGRRMGGAVKGLLEVGGSAIVLREVSALAQVADEILLVAADLEPWRETLAQTQTPVRLVADRQPGQGPLAGLDAAFAATGADAVLVVGSDLPFLDARLLNEI